jgi:probable rRNA maturation factor
MGKIAVDCLNRPKNLTEILSAVYKTLGQTDNLKAELIFMDAEEMQKLNRDTRGVDKVTDVLSYPSLDGIRGKVLKKEDYLTALDGRYIFIGSIVLCNQRIKEQAKELGHSESDEKRYLIVHGLMHLFGYDHIDDEDKKQMRQKEKEALALLGVKE